MNNDDLNKNEEEKEKLEVNNTSNNNTKTDQEKLDDLVNQINNISSPEEFMDFMNGLDEEQKKLLTIKKIDTPKTKKPIWLLFKVIETVVSILILVALTGLIRPFNLKMPYGDLYYMGAIALSVFVFGFGLHFIRKPFVVIFYEVIMDILVLICMITFSHVLPFISFTSELDEALFIVSFLSVKSILITFIKKYSEKFL